MAWFHTRGDEIGNGVMDEHGLPDAPRPHHDDGSPYFGLGNERIQMAQVRPRPQFREDARNRRRFLPPGILVSETL
jgi:hypothetical protein